MRSTPQTAAAAARITLPVTTSNSPCPTNASRMMTSQPSFGPCVPLSVVEPISVHAEKTPTTSAPIATEHTIRRRRSVDGARR
jgi:hypothetical protein